MIDLEIDVLITCCNAGTYRARDPVWVVTTVNEGLQVTCGKIIVDIAVSVMIPSLSGQRKLARRAILLLIGMARKAKLLRNVCL